MTDLLADVDSASGHAFDPAGPPKPRVGPISVAVGFFTLVGVVRAAWFAEGDTFWQVQTGKDILSRHSVFLTDTFSWTVAGRPWHPNSWLFDVLLSLAYRLAGPLGLALFALVTIALVGLTLGVIARSFGARAGALGVTAALLSLPLLAWLSARPQTVTYALLPLVVWLAARAVWWRGRRLAVAVAALFVLTALWMNLHLAALAAVPAVATGLAVVVLLHRDRWRRLVLRGCVVLAAVTFGCAASPFGFGALGSALATREASSSVVVEWAPLWRGNPVTTLTWLVAATAVGLSSAAWRQRPRDRVLPVLVGAAAFLLLGGVFAARFSPMALVVALPAVTVWASGVDWRTGRARRVAFPATRTAAALVVTLLVVAVVRLPDLGRPSSSDYPAASTVAAIPAGCRVLNEYDDGGYLILRRSTDGVHVAMDGRNDVYGAALIVHLQSLIDGRRGALAELARDRVGCLLLEPKRPLVAQAQAAGWTVAARDANRVLLLAAAGPSA